MTGDSMNRVRQTSIDAYNNIKQNGLLARKRWEVYDYLFHNGPCTARSMVKSLTEQGITLGWSCTGRLSELREAGVVIELGTVKCPETNQTVILWDVTSLATPIKPPKKLNRIKELEAEIERLRGILAAHGIAEQTEMFPTKEDPF